MFKYKNVSPYHLMIPNVGEVGPDAIIESATVLESHHLELVPEAEQPKIAPAAPVATIAAQAAPKQETS